MRLDDHRTGTLPQEKLTTLVCKRFPPTPQAALIMRAGQPDWISCTVWPGVEREDSCGEYGAHATANDPIIATNSTRRT